jgi:chromosome segregation ATPase
MKHGARDLLLAGSILVLSAANFASSSVIAQSVKPAGVTSAKPADGDRAKLAVLHKKLDQAIAKANSEIDKLVAEYDIRISEEKKSIKSALEMPEGVGDRVEYLDTLIGLRCLQVLEETREARKLDARICKLSSLVRLESELKKLKNDHEKKVSEIKKFENDIAKQSQSLVTARALAEIARDSLEATIQPLRADSDAIRKLVKRLDDELERAKNRRDGDAKRRAKGVSDKDRPEPLEDVNSKFDEFMSRQLKGARDLVAASNAKVATAKAELERLRRDISRAEDELIDIEVSIESAQVALRVLERTRNEWDVD